MGVREKISLNGYIFVLYFSGERRGMAPYNIGPRVEEARQHAGMTKAALAHRAHMRWAQLHKIITGQRLQVSADTVKRLAQALGCTADFLLGMDTPDDAEGRHDSRITS